MSPVLTEGKHAGEFISSEANGTRSRESGTVLSGQNLVDGQLVQLSGGKLIAKAATLNTEGEFAVAVEGIVVGNWNASASGANADIKNVPYIARDAEVKEDALTYPSEGTKDEAILALKGMGIIVRPQV